MAPWPKRTRFQSIRPCMTNFLSILAQDLKQSCLIAAYEKTGCISCTKNHKIFYYRITIRVLLLLTCHVRISNLFESTFWTSRTQATQFLVCRPGLVNSNCFLSLTSTSQSLTTLKQKSAHSLSPCLQPAAAENYKVHICNLASWSCLTNFIINKLSSCLNPFFSRLSARFIKIK